MKRTLSILCIITITLSCLTACSKKHDTKPEKETNTSITNKNDETNTLEKEKKEDSKKESSNKSKSSLKTIQVLYNNDESKFEVSFDPTNIEIQEGALTTPQPDIYLTYKTKINKHTYTLKVDSEAYTSKQDFYNKNFTDCKSMFNDAKASDMKEIKCGNISFYVFTTTYTDKSGKKNITPLYFAEIKEGVYCYIELSDTIQFDKVDEEMLKINEQMLKELFVDFKLI